MAIYSTDTKIDITIKRYTREPQERLELQTPYPPDKMELSEQHEHKNLTLREALQKLIELMY